MHTHSQRIASDKLHTLLAARTRRLRGPAVLLRHTMATMAGELHNVTKNATETVSTRHLDELAAKRTNCENGVGHMCLLFISGFVSQK